MAFWPPPREVPLAAETRCIPKLCPMLDPRAGIQYALDSVEGTQYHVIAHTGISAPALGTCGPRGRLVTVGQRSFTHIGLWAGAALPTCV